MAEVCADLEGRYNLKLKLAGTEDVGRAAALRPRLDEAERRGRPRPPLWSRRRRTWPLPAPSCFLFGSW